MGKQLKKYFVAGLQPKGINYTSPLGTDPAVRSVGSGSELCLGATSCKQIARETGTVRGVNAIIMTMVANRVSGAL